MSVKLDILSVNLRKENWMHILKERKVIIRQNEDVIFLVQFTDAQFLFFLNYKYKWFFETVRERSYKLKLW